jgi:hypothetical protein
VVRTRGSVAIGWHPCMQAQTLVTALSPPTPQLATSLYYFLQQTFVVRVFKSSSLYSGCAPSHRPCDLSRDIDLSSCPQRQEKIKVQVAPDLYHSYMQMVFESDLIQQN